MKLSICLITYNHQDYISDAIEGILKQETTFDFELLIGEDKSTDGTRRICESYASQFPDRVNLLPAAENLGMMKNFLRTYKACKGQYIAFIEGDDYWTDPRKLQKQVDFLEANPGYSACFHNVIIKTQRNNEESERVMHPQGLPTDTFTTEDVLGPWFIASPSFMFVNYEDFVLPEWFYSCKYGDLPLMLLLTLRGNFKYLDEVMGVYRLHDKGASIQHIGYDKIILMIFIYESFNIHTQYRYKQRVREAMIYEIDRHIPSNYIPKNQEATGKKRTLLERGYRKLVRSMAPR